MFSFLWTSPLTDLVFDGAPCLAHLVGGGSPTLGKGVGLAEKGLVLVDTLTLKANAAKIAVARPWEIGFGVKA